MSNISKIKVAGQIHDVMDATARQQLSSCVTEDKLPKNVSDLTNDSGFITENELPKKTSDLTNDSGFITENELPKSISDLTNDSGFITNEITDGLNTRLTTVQSQLSGLATELEGI